MAEARPCRRQDGRIRLLRRRVIANVEWIRWRLLPSRPDLIKARLDFQRQLIVSGIARHSPIQVTTQGVIFDGHHAVRAAAEEGRRIDVLVIAFPQTASGDSILDLPVV